jgi:hypothetical protein
VKWRYQLNSLVGAALALLSCLPVLAQSNIMQRSLSKSVKADHAIVLSGHSHFNKNCEGGDAPSINLEVAPAHGHLCLRRANVLLTYIVPGSPPQCLGQKVMGVRVIYLPRHGYTGPDAARYSVHLPRAQVDVDVKVTVVPDDSNSTTKIPADISAPEGDTVQEPGPIPECAALVS